MPDCTIPKFCDFSERRKRKIFLKFLFKVFDEALVSKIEILDPKEKSVFGEDEVFKCCVFRNKMNL